jgi:dethiobiotin synthetase
VNGGRLLVVTGTGTGIGKTHFSEALILTLARTFSRVAGVKPIETGMGEATVSDASRLERVSTFHVKHFGYVFAEALSPHLAARETDTPIRLDVLVPLIHAAQARADVLLVELPGGLFSPLSETMVNADLVEALEPDITLLVAPDRLGVLHETISTQRAARAAGVTIDGIVLMTPEKPDSSTGLNASELTRILSVPVVATIGRAAPADLATSDDLQALGERLHQLWQE